MYGIAKKRKGGRMGVEIELQKGYQSEKKELDKARAGRTERGICMQQSIGNAREGKKKPLYVVLNSPKT